MHSNTVYNVNLEHGSTGMATFNVAHRAYRPTRMQSKPTER